MIWLKISIEGLTQQLGLVGMPLQSHHYILLNSIMTIKHILKAVAEAQSIRAFASEGWVFKSQT